MQIRMSLATWALILFVPVWVSLQAQIGWDQEQETSETEKTEQVFFCFFFFYVLFTIVITAVWTSLIYMNFSGNRVSPDNIFCKMQPNFTLYS